MAQQHSNRTARLALVFFSVAALLLLVLIGLFALPQNPLHTRLDCDRATGRCVFEQTFRHETRSWPFRASTLGDATVVYTHGTHGGGRSSVYFGIGTQRFFYTSYTFPAPAAKAAATINAFVGDPARSRLALADDDSESDDLAWALLALAAFVTVGGFAFAWRRPSA